MELRYELPYSSSMGLKKNPPRLRFVGGMRSIAEENESIEIDLGAAKPGIFSTPDVFYKIDSQGEVEWIISRSCDHAHGKLNLCENGSAALCPMHHWRLNLQNLMYDGVGRYKKRLPYTTRSGKLHLSLERYALQLPEECALEHIATEVRVRFLAHACVSIEAFGKRLIIDPWLVGPCVATGWWHQYPPKSDALSLLADADFIYLSHTHSDHLHPATLEHVSHDTLLLIPNFSSHSVARSIERLGFTHYKALDFADLWQVDDLPWFVAVLPSGDGRDDSGIYLRIGDFSALFVVDSNGINNYVLPKNLTLLASAFSSGSSGYPLCFDNYDLQRKQEIIQRFKAAALTQVREYLRTSNPRYFMPYAGFFSEAATRDGYIHEHNHKNRPTDIQAMVSKAFPQIDTLNPLEHDELLFFCHEGQSTLTRNNVQKPPLYEVNSSYVEHYLHAFKMSASNFNLAAVMSYFATATWRDNLIVYLLPTEDDFTPRGEGLRIDFSFGPPHIDAMASSALENDYVAAEASMGMRRKFIKVRYEALWAVITGAEAFDSLYGGFQCRIHRKPDYYNAGFWAYFSNIHPSQQNSEAHLSAK